MQTDMTQSGYVVVKPPENKQLLI